MPIIKTVTFAGDRTFAVSINDICDEPVEAITNAANGYLQNAGGVARAISSAAGPAYEEDCARHIEAHGRIPAGEAVVTGSGALAERGIKGIINAVGPEWDSLEARERPQDYPPEVEALLARTIGNVLLRASEQGWISVSYPAISSNIFRVPHDICARAYIDGMRSFFADRPEAAPREIRLCNINEGEPIRTVLAEMDRLR